ncbi:MAG: SRPBCC family protein [Aestuariibacter sp.]
MYTIHVEKTLDMPIEKAFEAITDHQNYSLYVGIKEANLLRSGDNEKNGTGAIRQIKAGGMTLQEEITEFQKPTRMAYRIISAKPVGMIHPVGTINLSPVGDKTKVVWHSEFGFRFPVIGQWLDNWFGPKFSKAFSVLLRGMEKRYHFFNR